MKLNTKSGYKIENGIWNIEHQEDKCGIYESPIPPREGSLIHKSRAITLLFWITMVNNSMESIPKRWKAFPMEYLPKLFLREQIGFSKSIWTT